MARAAKSRNRTKSRVSRVAAIDGARAAFDRQAWREAYEIASAPEVIEVLDGDGLARLATAAHLIGRSADSATAWGRAHEAFVEQGDSRSAARAAFWVSFGLIIRRKFALASGWTARGRRLLGVDEDCVEQGYFAFLDALRLGLGGQAQVAEQRFREVVATGERFRDDDLATVARHAHGRALIYMGETDRGLAMLDQALMAIASGSLSPVFVGDIYCSAIAACRETSDMTRAQEWTDALSRWCETRPDAVPYRGNCAIHRSEILMLRGAWDDATIEATGARDALGKSPAHAALGAAWYQIGELHRVRGDFVKAEEAFREASRAGFDPQPGRSRLRLSQGNTAAAVAGVNRALGEATLWPARVRLLPAVVDVAIARGDLATAGRASAELSGIAGNVGAPLLLATAGFAAGVVSLAGGDATGSLVHLRRAAGIWQALRAPLEIARTRAMIGTACRELGDADAADAEVGAAREIFEHLGARFEYDQLRPESESGRAKGWLTSREMEVLELLATGKTNRGIATSLSISEKTVARHVSNIFMKLDLPNRAAATAYAHQQGLVGRAT